VTVLIRDLAPSGSVVLLLGLGAGGQKVRVETVDFVLDGLKERFETDKNICN
jgi:hypothetical protein